MGKTSITYLLFALLPKINSMYFWIHGPWLGVFSKAPFHSKTLELCVLARIRTHRLGILNGKQGFEEREQQGLKDTHRNQSTAMISVMSSVGRPTDVSTMTMVTRPAWGMPAAPTLAAVAVILQMEREHREAGDEKGR